MVIERVAKLEMPTADCAKLKFRLLQSVSASMYTGIY